jgi:hypothetical protein
VSTPSVHKPGSVGPEPAAETGAARERGPGAPLSLKTGVLVGDAFVRRTRTAVTVDGDGEGRWIAVDESGWNGEALMHPDEPYVSIGSVAVDDVVAGEIVAALRRDAKIKQAGELKFGHFAGGRGVVNTRRLEVLAELVGSGGPIADRASVYLIDTRYFVTSKIIDLLLEEFVHARGGDLYAGDKARKAAWTLFNEGPRALGVQLFDELIGRFTQFAGLRNRHQAQVTVGELFAVLGRAENRSTRRAVTNLLRALSRCREEADELQRRLSEPEFIATLEPLTPSMPGVLSTWADRLGPVSILLDAHKVWTDDHLDLVWQIMKPGRGLPNPLFGWSGVRLRGLVRGTSADHPSVQLADLVAGAGRAVAHFHDGKTSAAAAAGKILAPVVVPLITAEGLFAHDDPARFSTRLPRFTAGVLGSGHA